MVRNRTLPDAVKSTVRGKGQARNREITSMAAVGDGDHYPVTAVGHLMALELMIGGIPPRD
jgi:hypothetical protein